MCGIYCSLSVQQPLLPDEKTRSWLRRRGPDSLQTHHVQVTCGRDPDKVPGYLTFVSTVLALRGDHVQTQPLVDSKSQSILCWNGEAWKISDWPVEGNDTEQIFRGFIDASQKADADEALRDLTRFISSISGPFAFVFYDGCHSRLFYSRDYIGRRSLLHGQDEYGNLKICSVSDGKTDTMFEEVETTGLHMIDLAQTAVDDIHQNKRMVSKVSVIPWSGSSLTETIHFLNNPLPPMNRSLPTAQPPALTFASPSVASLEQRLRCSLEHRIQNIPQLHGSTSASDAKIAVLFSGGLDCTVLARLAHDILPTNEPIDLLNVAFENPRVAAAQAKSKSTATEDSIYESCPDRVTGRAGYAELQRVCPGRCWRFVAVDVPYSEFLSHRDEVIQLIKPHNTEMDLSIACALYFAARGQGNVPQDQHSHPATMAYTTPARVLLSGLGADELFAGYSRHGLSFSRGGFPALIDEVALDVGRLGKRNLGRDDRVISHWGREARFPYLDEELVAWANQTPIWERCGFGTATTNDPDDETQHLDSEKKVLRLLALKLGLAQRAKEKKRAIQFGARTAKMESGRSRGTHLLS